MNRLFHIMFPKPKNHGLINNEYVFQILAGSIIRLWLVFQQELMAKYIEK